jgi:hypothetical protein
MQPQVYQAYEPQSYPAYQPVTSSYYNGVVASSAAPQQPSLSSDGTLSKRTGKAMLVISVLLLIVAAVVLGTSLK